jgi:hypothetical protein
MKRHHPAAKCKMSVKWQECQTQVLEYDSILRRTQALTMEDSPAQDENAEDRVTVLPCASSDGNENGCQTWVYPFF